jgi:serine/threonine protein kinase
MELLAGHYQIVNHLGGGGFGQTFLARDHHLPSRPLCVVKQLKPRATDSGSLEVAKRLFDREAETLYQLGHHDQIPRLLAHFEQNQEFYLVQEYIPGETLSKELASNRQVSEAIALILLQDLLQVLAFVHQRQVIHRDIKPANLIRRNKDHRMVLIDFGAVKLVSTQDTAFAGETSVTVAIGSPGYMPCEQQAFHPRYSSDVYAVGMVALQALSGLHPKSFPADAGSGEYCCAAFGDRLSIHPGLATILDRMVRYDHRQRYENATVALQALQAHVQSIGQPLLSPSADGNTNGAIASDSPTEETATFGTLPVTQPPLSLATQPPKTFTPAPLPTPQDLSDTVKKSLEQLLAELIGPIATVIFQAALTQVSTLEDLLETLVERVPLPRRTQFRKQAELLLQNFDNSSIPTFVNSGATAATATPAVTADFVKRCEQELAKSVGPIAPVLVQRTLTRHPHLSSTQLIESLSQHLRDPKTAESFRQSLLALI